MAEELAPHAILPESWSVKEVVADLKKDLLTGQQNQNDHLDKQDLTLHEISAKVDTKADKADLVAINLSITGLGGRVATLETANIEAAASRKFRNRVWAIIGSVSGTIAILISALIAAHGG